MKKDLKVILGILALVVAVFAIAYGVYRKAETDREDAAPRASRDLLIRDDAWSLGPSMARVTIVEFLDPECESCAAFHPTVKKVLADYGQAVRLVVRYMPFHGNSVMAAAALEAAGLQGKYWEAMDLLFARQAEWGSHHDPRPDLIPVILAELNLDMNRFEEDLQSEVFKARIEKDREDGMKLGVRATPTFFVNGKILQSLGQGALALAIEEALAAR